MALGLLEQLYVFAFFAAAGWALECVYRSWRAGRFVDPGLLKGPYLPIYGFGAVLLNGLRLPAPDAPLLFFGAAFASAFPGLGSLLLSKPAVVAGHMLAQALVFLVATTSLEFFTGWSLKRFLNVRLWDYADERWTFGSHVCPKYAPCWVALAFALQYVFLPAALALYALSPLPWTILAIALLELMTVDFAVTVNRLLARQRAADGRRDAQVRMQAFLEIVASLLDHPEVRALEDYRHHYWKNRLEHSLEVAWISYRLARRLGLDATMTARGALLHDLFHYDWLREGPRGHGFRHPRIALENARGITELTAKEENIILRHMWPLTPVPPLYPESWIVSAIDTLCCTRDYLAGASGDLRRRVAVAIQPVRR